VLPYRMNRLFRSSGRCFAIAVDHGFPGETHMLEGIEDMEAAVDVLVGARPDAILLSPGQADLLQRRPGRDKPALILRCDVPNVYAPEPPAEAYCTLLGDPVGQAVRLDAAAVIVNLLEAPGQPRLRAACVENVLRLRAECDRAGMPLMIEPLVLKPGSGGYDIDGDLDRICGIVRQAVELGADVIKADPPADLAGYHRVITVARVPVLVRGGGRVGDREVLERTHALLGQGARGIVYGRNIIQHPDPAGMAGALAELVHEGAEPAAALDRLGVPAG
jgi:fructose-bisphosphate aldolase, class I